MDFLYFLLILFGIIILLRLFVRYVLPFILVRYVRKKQQEFFDMMNQQERSQKKEGEIDIKQTKKAKKSKGKALDDIGEYTDFEELDDK